MPLISFGQYMGSPGFPPYNDAANPLGGKSCPLEKNAEDKESIGKISIAESNLKNKTFTVTVTDLDINNCPTITQKVKADVWSNADLSGLQLDLMETGSDTGIFQGMFEASQDKDDHDTSNVLTVDENDLISVVYVDSSLPDSIPQKTWIGVRETIKIGDFTFVSDHDQTLPSPLKQWDSGVIPYFTLCHEDLVLTLKKNTGYPACVSPETSQKLHERGWSIQIPKIIMQDSQ